jgi:hypothetical protein
MVRGGVVAEDRTKSWSRRCAFQTFTGIDWAEREVGGRGLEEVGEPNGGSGAKLFFRLGKKGTKSDNFYFCSGNPGFFLMTVRY